MKLPAEANLDEEARDDQPELLAHFFVLRLVRAELRELDIDLERQLHGFLVEMEEGVDVDACAMLPLLDTNAESIFDVVDVVLLEIIQEFHQIVAAVLAGKTAGIPTSSV